MRVSTETFRNSIGKEKKYDFQYRNIEILLFPSIRTSEFFFLFFLSSPFALKMSKIKKLLTIADEDIHEPSSILCIQGENCRSRSCLFEHSIETLVAPRHHRIACESNNAFRIIAFLRTRKGAAFIFEINSCFKTKLIRFACRYRTNRKSMQAIICPDWLWSGATRCQHWQNCFYLHPCRRALVDKGILNAFSEQEFLQSFDLCNISMISVTQFEEKSCFVVEVNHIRIPHSHSEMNIPVCALLHTYGRDVDCRVLCDVEFCADHESCARQHLHPMCWTIPRFRALKPPGYAYNWHQDSMSPRERVLFSRLLTFYSD